MIGAWQPIFSFFLSFFLFPSLYFLFPFLYFLSPFPLFPFPFPLFPFSLLVLPFFLFCFFLFFLFLLPSIGAVNDKQSPPIDMQPSVLCICRWSTGGGRPTSHVGTTAGQGLSGWDC